MRSPAHFSELCRKHNLAATHQRRIIYETVLAVHGHPSPETIFEAVRKKIPSISLATVYKNVHTFVNSGILREVGLHHGSIRVEPAGHEHHHLTCESCGEMIDIEPDGVSGPIRIKARLPRGFRVTRVAVDILGICSSCAARRNDNSSLIRAKRREPKC